MCVSSSFQKLDSFAGKFRDLYHVMVGLPNKVVTGYDSDSYNSYEATTAEKVTSDDIWALGEYFFISLGFF